MLTIDLTGRVAVVTGAATGIGQVIANTLADAGASVAICDVSADAVETFRRNHPRIAALVGDVAKVEDVDALFALAEGQLGMVDVLVNNAGIAGPTARIEDTPIEGWDATLRVNLTGPFLCARRATPSMREAGRGAIINICSVAGRLGFPLRIPYSATKWGLVGMTQTLAMELGPSGIRVNAVLPGAVEGERVRGVIDSLAQSAGITFDQSMENFVSRISMRTMVQPNDIASMVAFLVSDLGRHISGQSISVCGNFESYGSPSN
jgi:NAD(P)-dependent dehydrogenase (short-subunit alcohol dehydrogenase family)